MKLIKSIKPKSPKSSVIVRTISDMDMDGVRFSKIENDICNYSGLPSVSSYGK
jgi:hypothetical protein